MISITRVLVPPVVTGAGAIGLLALRGVAGVALMHHGWSKIQNPFGWMGPDSAVPAVLQALAALSEFVGGLAWILGLLTPIAALGLLCTMAVAVSTHVARGDPFVGRGGSYELALVYFAVALLLLLLGPGGASLDTRIFARLRRQSTYPRGPVATTTDSP